MPDAVTISRTDVLRCNRLRGLSVATCSCRTGPDTPDNHAGWLECPPGARGVLENWLIEECRSLAKPVVLATAFITPRPPKGNERPLAQYTGEHCDNCGGLEMVRTGACSTCQQCGTSGGCG